MENNTTMETKKTVFISVPIENKLDTILDRAIQVAKREYCKQRGVDPKDITFVDFLHDIKKNISKEEIEYDEKIARNPGLSWTAYSIGLIGDVDEVVFGLYWNRSRHCKVLAKACETYFIPQIRIMKKEERNPQIEEKEEMKQYREKHHIEMVWKE